MPIQSALSRFLLSLPLFAFALPAIAQNSGPSFPGEIDLPTLAIIANRTPTDTRAVGSAITIIDHAELERRQIKFVADALRTVPGLAVARTGSVGGVTDVRIRGSESNQTLVLVDGIEINDPALNNSTDFSSILSLEVERIEVLRGPQSALYGSDAIGGVVNIITRRGDGAAKLRASVEGGNPGTVAGNASVSGGGDKYDYLFAGGGFRTDGFSSASSWRGNPERDGYANGTAFGKFGFNPLDILRIDVVGRATQFFGDYDTDFGQGAFDGPQTFDGRKLFGRATATLDLFEGRWQQIFGVTGSQQLAHNFDPFFVPTDNDYEGDKSKIDWQSNIFVDSDALDAKHIITVALDHEVERAKANGSSDFDHSVAQTGIVGQYQLGLWNDLFLTGSVRHDINQMFGDSTTWRATGAYNIDASDTKLRASIGTGVKSPTLFELFGFFGTYIPNPDLVPEQARGWDAGFDQKLLDGRVVFDATYFNQQITNLIQDTGTTSINLPGVSRIHGVELGLSANPVDPLTIRASYTWMHGVDANGDELVRRPSNAASLNVGYAFLDGRANLDLGLIYAGARKDLTFDASFNKLFVDLPAYVLVNLAASYKVSDKVELYARAENIFDVQYEEVYTYGGTGRTVIGGVRVGF